MKPDIKTAEAPAVSAERLELHVIGAGKGESIVIRLPDDAQGRARWGVVDCYAQRVEEPETNATLAFLQQAGVSELEFLCLTHPHADHYRGMSQLLEHLTVRRFWRFNFEYRLMAKLVNTLVMTARGKEAEEEPSSARDLLKTLRLVREKRIPSEVLVAGQHLYPMPRSSQLSIQALTPSVEHIDRFAEGVEHWSGQAPKRKIPPRLDANQLSGALLIIYGKTKIILGGDAEAGNWQHALARFPAVDLAAHTVKVSHHGSSNGYCAGLWKTFCLAQKKRTATFAVIAPYCEQDLPTREAVEHILEHTSRIYTTCIPATPKGEWRNTPRGKTLRWNVVSDEEMALEHCVPFLGFQYMSKQKQTPGIVSLSFNAKEKVYGPFLVGQAGLLI